MGKIIYDFTANPFVDAGIWAISERAKKKPNELNKADLKGIIDDVIKLYLTKKWSKNIYSVFPNNPITNPSVKNKDERYSALLNELIDGIGPLGNSGDCIACGKRDVQQRSGKDKIPLTGSGKLINYFSYGVEGADYCPACAFAVQFSPLIMYACGKLLLIHSNSEKVMNIWSRKANKNINKQLSSGEITGCFNEKYTNPKNALFHIIQDIVLEYDVRWIDEAPSINCYHFTNYNQGPDLDIYYVPTSIFKFLAYVPQHEKYEDWLRIVRRGYRFVKWDEVKEENEYKNNPNRVYNNLLEGRSIIRFFIDRKNKEAIGGWDLLSSYLEEVRNMDEKRIKTIKKVGDELADYIKASDDIKTLKKLETASNYRNYRNLLRIIIKKRIENGAESPLFSFDEYVNNLFPEGNLTWRETQDLILFRIYEVLHDWIIQQGISEELVTEVKEMEAENV
ncbi:MAG: type I-B CRISPR-associated protein Cas8b1/Cst1 [Candidatus Atribacteria bacterium]|nr:type I-B CRISPR-associated protein Cas8b1/Cst1 [Candidatus Atribacteria bacterium]